MRGVDSHFQGPRQEPSNGTSTRGRSGRRRRRGGDRHGEAPAVGAGDTGAGRTRETASKTRREGPPYDPADLPPSVTFLKIRLCNNPPGLCNEETCSFAHGEDQLGTEFDVAKMLRQGVLATVHRLLLEAPHRTLALGELRRRYKAAAGCTLSSESHLTARKLVKHLSSLAMITHGRDTRVVLRPHVTTAPPHLPPTREHPLLPSYYRSQVCPNWRARVKCEWGMACHYAHGEAQLYQPFKITDVDPDKVSAVVTLVKQSPSQALTEAELGTRFQQATGEELARQSPFPVREFLLMIDQLLVEEEDGNIVVSLKRSDTAVPAPSTTSTDTGSDLSGVSVSVFVVPVRWCDLLCPAHWSTLWYSPGSGTARRQSSVNLSIVKRLFNRMRKPITHGGSARCLSRPPIQQPGNAAL